MKDQVIVITGASSGIGAALGELVGAKGARPVLLARREKELGEVASRSGPEALPLVVDVTRRDEVAGAVETVLARFARIENPRADVYTRPGAHKLVVDYYAAEDMGQREQAPPFVAGGAPKRS